MLSPMFDAMHGFIVGKLSHEEAVQRLGLEPGSADARRLLIHRRAYYASVLDNANITFPVTRRVVERARGEAAWTGLITRLGTEHPMAEIRFGTAPLVDLLAREIAEHHPHPPWLAELAELELAERRVLIAPDSGAIEPGLHVADPLTILTHRFDVLAVRSASEPTEIAPPMKTTVLAIWRARDGERRTKALDRLTLRILHTVRVGGGEALGALRDAPELKGAPVDRAASHLHAIELLRGEFPAS